MFLMLVHLLLFLSRFCAVSAFSVSVSISSFHCSICPSVPLNSISAALVDIATSSHADTNLIRPKTQVGFWCQLRVLLKRHLVSMSRDMVSVYK